jgi:hypothetical protein
MEDHQREYLIEEFEGFVEDISSDLEADGRLSRKNASWVDRLTRALEWLRGARGAGSELRELFEERLEAYDAEVNFDAIAYEHDALTAAVEDLR